MSSVAGLLLGLLVGLRHAFEPDHLTAMATLVGDSSSRPGARRGALLGAIWGVGHTVSLVVVGLVLILAGEGLPERVTATFELGVAVLLVGLGVRAIHRALHESRLGPPRPHSHGNHAHSHEGPTAHLHVGRATLAWRPLVIGLVHGLAGSGALTALVFAQLATASERLAYISLFGIGSIAGMAVASAIAGASLRGISPVARQRLAIGVGLVSIVLGVVWSLPLYSQ